MDFKVNRETLGVSETTYDNNQEQSIELDYVLPDYYPDIFKLIKCLAKPEIVSRTMAGNKATYELTCCVRILYCSEGSEAVQCVTQKLTYSKTVDLGQVGECPILTLTPKLDYINCRAVNQRRIDLRGAISTRVRLVCRTRQQVVSDASGMGIQLRKMPVECVFNKLSAFKRIVVSEEVDLGYAKSPVSNILWCSGLVTTVDQKIIANKIVAKGEAKVSILYTCQTDGKDTMESMQFMLPFSQVMDLDGIDDSWLCLMNVEAAGCEAVCRSNPDGENKLLDCDLALQIQCTAMKSMAVEVVTDAYSTQYPVVGLAAVSVRTEKLPRSLSGSCKVEMIVSPQENQLEAVYDLWGEVRNVSAQVNSAEQKITVMGNLLCQVMAKTTEGVPVLLESAETFEYNLPAGEEGVKEGAVLEPDAAVLSLSFTMPSAGKVEVTAEIRIRGELYDTTGCQVLTDMLPDESTPRPQDDGYALRLYFADEGENVWDIAKRYGTSVDAVTSENELTSEVVDHREMLLIPMVE